MARVQDGYPLYFDGFNEKGLASGAVLYVVFGEILPQAILMYHSKLPAFSVIVGMLLGLLIIFA